MNQQPTPESQYPQGIKPRYILDKWGEIKRDPDTGERLLDPQSFNRADGGSPLLVFASEGGEVLKPLPTALAHEALFGPAQNWHRGIRPRLATDDQLEAWQAAERAKANEYALRAVQEARQRAEGARLVELENFAREANLAEKHGEDKR